MKSKVHWAALAVAASLIACGSQSNSIRDDGSVPNNTPSDTALGLEEYANVVMLAIVGVSGVFDQDIESVRSESQSRCLSGSLTVNTLPAGNFDDAIGASLNNCQSVAGAPTENGTFSTYQKDDGSDFYVELGNGANFVNSVEQFEDGVILNTAYRGWFQNTRTSTTLTRRADVDLRNQNDQGASISASLDRTVVFDTTSDAGSVDGQVAISAFEFPGSGNCADVASYDIQTTEPFLPSSTGSSEALGISGGNIIVRKNLGVSTATVSFTDDGRIRVTQGNRSEIFDQATLENLCGSGTSR